MWLGLLVFAFVLVVGLMTKWRVHSQVCDQHLAALPSPHDTSVKEAAFGHGSILFQLNNFYHLFFFWIRRPKREVEKKKNALPTPVPTPRCVEVLREWTASVADTYRLQLFGRRCVVTSAPAFARRVLHTHFKLYEKNPKGDSNTQFPPALAWFIGYDGLFTRADQKDRAPHASQRISFARALLRDVETPSVIRAAVRRAARGAEGSENPAWYTTTDNSVPVVTLDTLRQFAVRCTLETLLGDTSKYLTPAQVNSLTSTLADVVDEVETELETPWRDLWIRISPRCRALKKKLHAAIAPCVDKCLEDALKPRVADGAQAPPNALEAYLRAEIPTMPADTKPKVLASIHAVFRKNLSSEVLTALLKAHMAMGPAVAWAAHYAALPQMHSLVRAIRNEATSAPGDRTAAAAAAAGATEAIREVLRLHPPVPVISRVVLHDDMVAVPDLSVPLDKFWHEAAAEQDSVTRTSFVQRSGCLVVPSSSVVVINMDVLLKRTDLFGSDAAEFQPKRFLLSDETAAAASAGAAAGGARNSDPKTWFLSGGFGIGARGCPASHWALPVAAEMLREVLRDHNLTVRTGGPSWSLAAAKL